MTLTLELPTYLEARLRQEAARAGVEPGEYVRQVVAHHLAAPASTGSVVELFDQWREADPPSDADEVARRQAEFQRFADAMNRNREESEGPNGRKPYP